MTHLAPVADFTASERGTLGTMLERGINTPITSSAGRVFDGVAALVGLRQRTSYEGEAASEVEWAAGDEVPSRPYEFALRQGNGALVVDWEPAIHAILGDIAAGRSAATIAASFHAGMAQTIADVAARIGVKSVVLSGGCFQNGRLTEATVAALRAHDLLPHWHERVPPNDGGLALGQAYWAAKMAGDF
jgi:hydrogenase maturation protein HypF